MRTVILTLFALVAFAANSIICRMALGSAEIDPASFSTIRLASGALVVLVIVRMNRKESPARHPGSWMSAAMLFLYAISFSFAYVRLSVGTGALIAFGAVQTTMISTGLYKGDRPHLMTWTGLMAALSGLVYLVLPGLESPPLAGTVFMVTAGVTWGVYSLRGFNVRHPIAVTGDNFLRSLPFALVVSLVMVPGLSITAKGLAWAVISGALFSGIGYVIWYAALQNLSTTRAATVQLFVPVIAAFGGVLFLSEQITLRLILAAILIIGGVGLTLVYKNRQSGLSLSKGKENMKTIKELMQRRDELEKEIAETKKRLPAHSAKPPVMMDLLTLEDEYDAILKQIERLKNI